MKGSGDGFFSEGYTTQITAANAPFGFTFAGWSDGVSRRCRVRNDHGHHAGQRHHRDCHLRGNPAR